MGRFLVMPKIERRIATIDATMLRAVSPNTEIPVIKAEHLIVLRFTNMNSAINGSAQIIVGKIKESNKSIIFIKSVCLCTLAANLFICSP